MSHIEKQRHNNMNMLFRDRERHQGISPSSRSDCLWRIQNEGENRKLFSKTSLLFNSLRSLHFYLWVHVTLTRIKLKKKKQLHIFNDSVFSVMLVESNLLPCFTCSSITRIWYLWLWQCIRTVIKIWEIINSMELGDRYSNCDG